MVCTQQQQQKQQEQEQQKQQKIRIKTTIRTSVQDLKRGEYKSNTCCPIAMIQWPDSPHEASDIAAESDDRSNTARNNEKRPPDSDFSRCSIEVPLVQPCQFEIGHAYQWPQAELSTNFVPNR